MGENATPAKTEQKKAINRLKSIYPLRNVIQQDYLDALHANKEGKPVVWAMVNMWEGDLPLKAMGINLIYPENYSTLLASTGTAERFLDASDADGYPTHMCGYARCTLGYAYDMMAKYKGKIPPDIPLGGMPKPALLLGSGMTCDARFKLFQALGRYFDTPQWCLEFPQSAPIEGTEPDIQEHQVKFMVKELNDYIAFLEKLFGKKMDMAKLEDQIDLAMQIHETTVQFTELRKAVPSPMHAVDFWSIMSSSQFVAGNLSTSLKLYQDVLTETRERVNSKISGINYPEKYRLVFSELPPWHNLNIFDTLAERGWNFVYESKAYHQDSPPDLSKVSNPVEQLARLCLNAHTYWLLSARANGISNYLVNFYLKIAREYKADGFFMHSLLSCRPTSVHIHELQDFLLRKLDVPSLFTEGDIVDKRVFNVQEVLSRAEAFEQTMEHYRKVRKAKGLDW